MFSAFLLLHLFILGTYAFHPHSSGKWLVRQPTSSAVKERTWNNNNMVIRTTVRAYFKKKERKGRDDGNTSGNEGGFFNTLKSYIPGLKRIGREKADETAPDTGYRYELRLTKKKNTGDKRHMITRIMRFLPDIQWETACDIVDTAFQNGKSIVRILNSEKEAVELQNVLLRADPPVVTEIFDNKKGELIV